MGPSKTWLKELLGTVFNSLILTFSNKCRLWCVNICSGLQKCLPIVRVLRVKNQTYKMRQIGCVCLQAWMLYILTSVWVLRTPNAGRNIHHMEHIGTGAKSFPRLGFKTSSFFFKGACFSML